MVCGTICSGFHYFVFLNGMMWRCGWLIRLITNYCGAIDERKVHESMQSRYDDIMERGAAALQENAYTTLLILIFMHCRPYPILVAV